MTQPNDTQNEAIIAFIDRECVECGFQWYENYAGEKCSYSFNGVPCVLRLGHFGIHQFPSLAEPPAIGQPKHINETQCVHGIWSRNVCSKCVEPTAIPAQEAKSGSRPYRRAHCTDEHLDRLGAMIEDEHSKWDLSDNDIEAITEAFLEIKQSRLLPAPPEVKK
jgi:hypothetical protein